MTLTQKVRVGKVGTAAEWATFDAAGFRLATGEYGWDTTNAVGKYGDGSTSFASLSNSVSGSGPRAKVKHSTTQSLGTSGTAANLVFDTEDADCYDIGGFHSTSVNTGRLTIPSGADGLYLVGATVTFASNATGRRGAALLKNGSQIHGAQTHTFASGAGTVTSVQVVTEVVAAAGDYFQVEAVQNSGGALNVNGGTGTAFWCRRIA